jgi:cytochrome c oxidase subunit 2
MEGSKMKKLLLISGLFVLMSALAACGGTKQEPADTPAPAGDNAASGREVKIVATNYSFDQEIYTVKRGENVTLVLENAGGVHGAEILGTGINLAGKKSTQTVTFDKAGEYNIVCSIPCGSGHSQMRAKLVVE